MEELKTFISGLDPEKGDNRYHAHTVIRKKWDEFNKVHSKESRKLLIKKPSRDSGPVYSDKKANDKLVREWIVAHDQYKQRTRIIFGKYFDEVEKLIQSLISRFRAMGEILRCRWD